MKLQRCASEIRQHLPLVVSRLFVDSLDESDLQLELQSGLTVYQLFADIWTKTDDFVEWNNLNVLQREQMDRYLLPTKFFGEDHGYLEDEKQLDRVHRRLRIDNGLNLFDMLVEMRKFKHLYSILCLNKPENAKCESHYRKTSCATFHIEYLPREHTIVLPVGLMLLLQEVYDEKLDTMDHYSRVSKDCCGS